ncbi:MAG: sigma-70 region 4 domain-containing protein [Bacteroidetes bacterium]|nr:sigma-70 region 4 domain-containing protein [Bacteroidota bacterium]
MRNKINISLIRCRREYSYKEIAELFNIHVRTVQIWRKRGLNILNGTSKPILILGSELKRYLQEKRKKKKRPLKDDEFYCTRCNEPRKSIPDKIMVVQTGKLMGDEIKQLRIKGICSVCACSLSRLSSENQIKELKIS